MRARDITSGARGTTPDAGGLHGRGLHILRVLVLCAVLLAMLGALSGCKYSDVLTEHIEDPDIGILDPEKEPIYENVAGAPKIEDLIDSVEDMVNDFEDQVEMTPYYDPDAPDNGPTKARSHVKPEPHDEPATEGGEEGEADQGEGGAGGTGDQASSTPTDDAQGDSQGDGNAGDAPGEGEGENDEGANTGTGDTLADENAADQGDQSQDGGRGDEAVVIGDEGTNTPATQGTVAAVGQYATITQMLAGPGGLVAADQEWLSSIPAGVFPGELANVAVGFSGDGSAAGSAFVDELINNIRPAVVLWDGVKPALTDDDRARLTEAGIAVQPVPAIGNPDTEDADIMQAVIEVAEVLSGVTTVTYDPAAMRDSYLQFHNSVLEAAYNANGAAYSYKAIDDTGYRLYQANPAYASFSVNATNARTITAYIDDWWMPGLNTATFDQRVSTASGVIRLGHDGEELDVSDGVALSATTSANAYMVLDYYLQFAGLVNNAYDQDKPQSNGMRYQVLVGRSADLPYVGLFSSRARVDSGLWCNSSIDSSASTAAANWKLLGSGEFPGILVRTREMANSILASAAKSNGLYHIKDGDGSTVPYRVYVVPSGVSGSWAYGNVESYLTSLWALRVRSDDALASAEAATASFYQTFYRCSDWGNVVQDFHFAETAGG